MKKITKEALENVIDGLVGSVNKESIELYKHLVPEYLGALDLNSPDEFYLGFIYPHEKYLRGLITSEIKITNAKYTSQHSERIIFLMQHSNFIKAQFEKLIIKVEGMACCADKSKTILRRLLLFYTTGEEIVWDYNGEYTFHLPKQIFITHDEIIAFFEATSSLYYGSFEKYLEAMQQYHNQFIL